MAKWFRQLEDPVIFKKALAGVFLACLLYWVFLIRYSQMAILTDAIGYESLGRMIHEQGWTEFFRTGPNREPLYPVTIAFSMRWAEVLGVSYQTIQKLVQVFILALTQGLMLMVMHRLGIRRVIQLAAVLYFGFSPAVVNSAFSLFSEVVTYPAVLGILLSGVSAWRAVIREDRRAVARYAAMTAFFFTWAAFGKGVFQYVFVLFLIPFLVNGVAALVRRDRGTVLRVVLFAAITSVLFGAALISYRAANFRYNGKFDFTNRYDRLFYGNALKRTMPMDAQRLGTFVASVPGSGVCHQIFGKETCWPVEVQFDEYVNGRYLLPQLEGVPPNEIAKRTMLLSLREIGKNPVQYVFLTALESLKMAFWESTRIGFVIYPPFLSRLFDATLFKNGLRFLMTLVTYAALILGVRTVWRERYRLLRLTDPKAVQIQILFFALWMILTFTGLYSFYSILTRFAFPMVSLYLIVIACSIDTLFRRAS